MKSSLFGLIFIIGSYAHAVDLAQYQLVVGELDPARSEVIRRSLITPPGVVSLADEYGVNCAPGMNCQFLVVVKSPTRLSGPDVTISFGGTLAFLTFLSIDPTPVQGGESFDEDGNTLSRVIEAPAGGSEAFPNYDTHLKCRQSATNKITQCEIPHAHVESRSLAELVDFGILAKEEAEALANLGENM